jgi:3-hydroxyacyl-CoA dehydrogenase
LGYEVEGFAKNLSFEKDLDKAVANADLIQENGPENIGFKQDLYAQIEKNAKPTALVLSSSSSIPASVLCRKLNYGTAFTLNENPFCALLCVNWNIPAIRNIIT